MLRGMCAEPRDKKPDEVEVTPEMIRAGAAELALYSDDYESKEDAAARIFEAMWLARPRAHLDQGGAFSPLPAWCLNSST